MAAAEAAAAFSFFILKFQYFLATDGISENLSTDVKCTPSAPEATKENPAPPPPPAPSGVVQ